MKNRLLVERAAPRDGEERPTLARKSSPRRARSVTVNLAESPLGWLRARDLLTERQFTAGEMLRSDYERAQLSPSVTMRWYASPLGRSARGAPDPAQATHTQLEAKARFDAAVADAGRGMAGILWRNVCAGEGMRDAERALGWPARAGRLVLTLALDRLADHYRMR